MKENFTKQLVLLFKEVEFSFHRDFSKHSTDNRTQYFVRYVGFIFGNVKNVLKRGYNQNRKDELIHISNTVHMCLQQIQDF